MTGNYVIAGGTKGIGLEIVNQLRATANSVQVYSRQVDSLITDETVQHHVVDFTQDDIMLDGLPNSINGVVYCPGSINLRSFRSLKLQDFRSDLEVNLLGAVKLLQACMKGLKKGGTENPSSVVMFSTIAVSQGLSMHASVAASKAAVEGLTRTIANEWAPNVRVNCLAPALTNTPLAARFFENEETVKAMAAKYPLGRTGLPTDLASAAAFLLSPSSSWITGQVLSVDGGMSTVRK
jgi:NAD(P)-dependent dehydrogenase (short-subunit alcohol dehydrogenase family)